MSTPATEVEAAPRPLVEARPLRLVYGVSGEGSGHAVRSREVLRHLAGRGHEIRVVTYDRGLALLGGEFAVFPTVGLSIATTDNAVAVAHTLRDNLARVAGGQRRLHELKRDLFEDFGPDCVITDFEPMMAHLARAHGVPLLSLDNQHLIRYVRYPCPRRLRRSQLLTLSVIRAMVPSPDAAVVTTFFFGAPRNQRTFMVPPIVRREVTDAAPAPGDHVLVYLTRGFSSLVRHLRSLSRQRFVVYGAGEQAEGGGNVELRPFSAEGFVGDLAGARAVIATAGFSLISEALHLGVPYLAVPMRGQFEQELNAHLLGELGFGVGVRHIDGGTVEEFLARVPELRERVAAAPRAGNAEVNAALDGLLADGCARLVELRRARRAGELPA